MTNTTSPRPTHNILAEELAPGDTITQGQGVYAISWDSDYLVRITWTHREVNGSNRAQSLVRNTTPYEVFG